MNQRYTTGDLVRPVQGAVRTMNPHRYCLGKVCTVVRLEGRVAGMNYYCIEVDGFTDYVDECNLDKV